MITRLHGIDRQKKHSTISMLDSKGEEVVIQSRCIDLKAYKYIIMKKSKKVDRPNFILGKSKVSEI